MDLQEIHTIVAALFVVSSVSRVKTFFAACWNRMPLKV